jgi:hypothetical protein
MGTHPSSGHQGCRHSRRLHMLRTMLSFLISGHPHFPPTASIHWTGG